MKVTVLYGKVPGVRWTPDAALTKVDELEIDGSLLAVREWTFRAFNAVDGTERCCQLGVRSMSVGDVLEIEVGPGEVRVFACEPIGWRELEGSVSAPPSGGVRS